MSLARGTAGVALVGVTAAALMNFQLLPRFTSSVAGDPSDPALQAWEIAWGGHALVHEPSSVFDANAFWPLENTLAFSDALVGYWPSGLAGEGTTAALIRYNLLYLFAFAFALFGAALLARELGTSWTGALAGGIAFAYAPWRLSQLNHLNILSSGGIPLSLFLLVRGHRRQDPRLILSGWFVATWQMSLGFNLGLQLAYLLLVIAVLWGVHVLLRRVPFPPRRVLVAGAVGAVAFAAGTSLLALPYLEVVQEHPEARRNLEQVAGFSPPKRSVFAAPASSRVWADATAEVRRTLPWSPEQSLFPGVVAPTLALVGLLSGVYRRKLRLGLATGTMVMLLLSFGFRLAGGRFTYRLLYDYLPGWQGFRTPGRLMTLTTLGLSLLVAAGVTALTMRIGKRRRAGRRLRAAGSIGLLIALLIEGSGDIRTNRLPPPPVDLSELADPQLHLPLVVAESLYMYWSVDGFPRLANGYSGVIPDEFVRLANRMQTFPDTASVGALQALGVRTVIFHRALAEGTPWEDVPDRPLPRTISRRPIDGAIVYTVADP